MEVEGVVTPEGQSRIIMVTKKSWEKRGGDHDDQEVLGEEGGDHDDQEDLGEVS